MFEKFADIKNRSYETAAHSMCSPFGFLLCTIKKKLNFMAKVCSFYYILTKFWHESGHYWF